MAYPLTAKPASPRATAILAVRLRNVGASCLPFVRYAHSCVKYTHEKHTIKLMIRSAWTALFQRLLTSGLFSFFSGQAAYEGMARV